VLNIYFSKSTSGVEIITYEISAINIGLRETMSRDYSPTILYIV
jgi:hypothetical protein